MVVWFRENVLICTKCVCRGVLFWENVLDGTKNSFARKWWGIQPLIKISSPEMSPFAEDFVITDIYIFAVLNNNTGKYVYKCNNTCVSCIFVWMDEGRVWIGYNEKDCLPRNPQTNIL